MPRSQKITLGALAGAAIVLLVLAARFDLPLNQALYRPTDPFAIFMEAVCWWPLWLPFALLGAIWSAKTGARRIAGFFLMLATPAALGAAAYLHFIRRGCSVPVSVLFSALPALAVMALCVFLRREGRYTRQRMEFVAQFGLLFCAAENVVITLLKSIWSRPRFDDMLAAGSLDSFSAWYAPGGAGGSSFPSGHTAAACGVLLLLLLPVLFSHLGRHAEALTLLCYGYVALSGYARLRIGRHFLSDTVGAALVTSALFFILLRLPAVRRKLAQLAP